MISVAVPSYNEFPTISEVVAGVRAQKPWVRQIIVVDDGSTDSTGAVLEDLRVSWSDPEVELTVVRFARNRGKGAAVRAAVEVASQPYFMIQDADGELSPADYSTLVEPVRLGVAGAVFGDRFFRGFPAGMHPLSRLANRIVTGLSNVLYGLGLRDQACGYKLIPTALARDLELVSDGFEICSELTAKLGRRRVTVASVPVQYRPRTVREGKKVRWKDGFKAVYTLVKYRFRR